MIKSCRIAQGCTFGVAEWGGDMFRAIIPAGNELFDSGNFVILNFDIAKMEAKLI